MKRSKGVLTPRFKKRLSVPTASAVAVSLTLTGCSPEPMQETAQVYKDVTECIQVNPDQAQLCESVFGEALAIAEETAPQFASLADCELEFGADQCMAGGSDNDNADSGGGWFMPMMYGYMLGNMLSGSKRYKTAPVYSSKNRRSPMYGKLVTGAGNTVGRAGDRIVRTSPSNFTPQKATKVSSRGGFGKIAQTKAVQSSKSTSSRSRSSSRSWGG
ncbi:DUF1190 domain-containing protein [Ferrimonas aestuarii]|uniref:DUF1190 domain-containing protein n=1 Tax=Ferrimonas aestuarii TaxID=2569539 RepID=A0A4U1BJR8_9GAMM|nr:DUF1190 domain-containing protein [Ferrimonas aestuarii]TKB51680.1 DUF1190 domain-containing protein [Ferrimonas aestuarii]